MINKEYFLKAIKPYTMAMISVFISIFSLSVVSMISSVGKEKINAELDGVGMNGMTVTAYSNYKENITDIALYNSLRKCDYVNRITPVRYDTMEISLSNGNELQCLCWGISPMAKDVVNLKQMYGRGISDGDINNSSLVCLIDESIALQNYGRSNITGKDLYITTDSGVHKLEIIGVVNKTSSLLNGMSGDIIPNFIYLPFTTMENISFEKGFDQLIINIKEGTTVENIIGYIKSNAVLPMYSTIEISDLSRQRDNINNITEIAFLMLFAISCVALIVCSISVATSVSSAVSQAKHDIGIKISIGASKLNIMSEFLILSVSACLIGIFFGISIGYISLGIVNFILKETFSFDTGLLVIGVSATIFLTATFSLYPSYKAASMIPIKALSRE
ncbi:MAG: ABC transporter permease [Oscillospiraceae bacterium]|nr:ABC transporter permease [Oscillospiraceae bacterium]